jgi:hypothetical protein
LLHHDGGVGDDADEHGKQEQAKGKHVSVVRWQSERGAPGWRDRHGKERKREQT